ncbi:hypothetical protein L0Y65_01335 [Candidatus Micrarchaeota archaeon]|nr:hypothetical protein [Candidatus Micrarchaeota archaeon]
MAARLIDISRLSGKQLDELARTMKKHRHDDYKPAFRTEPADRMVFAPLAEAIARDGCRVEEIEKNFRATKFRNFERMRSGGEKSHLSYYLGFLFETAVQMSILRFSQENPELLSVLRNTSGELDGGRRFMTDSRGSAVFYKPTGSGRTTRMIAEIDLVGEIHDSGDTAPAIFEITLMNGCRKNFKSRRKGELLGELYGRKPYFCVIRPAYNDEKPGASIQFSRERGFWRDLLVPRNEAIREIALRLIEEEHMSKEAGLQAAASAASGAGI